MEIRSVYISLRYASGHRMRVPARAGGSRRDPVDFLRSGLESGCYDVFAVICRVKCTH